MPALEHEMVPEELVVYEGRLMAFGDWYYVRDGMCRSCGLVVQEYDVAAAQWITFRKFPGGWTISDKVSAAVLELPVELPLRAPMTMLSH